MAEQIWLWIGFNVFVLAMLALDLGVFHRKAHVVSFKESITWTVVWVVLALLFNVGVWRFYGSQKALEFFTGYLIEKSLSVDNVFVLALLFSYFAVPPVYQHKVLFWGILGALIMRAIMIALGAALIAKFTWIIYVFGTLLILTGIKMVVKREEDIHPERNPVVRWFKKLVPVTSDYREDPFFVKENGRRWATPLFVVLLLVEFSDLIFAVVLVEKRDRARHVRELGHATLADDFNLLEQQLDALKEQTAKLKTRLAQEPERTGKAP